ncbi:non-ribosomal peptide synthetase [Streptomyces sp. NRRL F-2747]|uniref:non-ribosomal peptide synthetase n=1 Tax=Streptomyces sp. NRRL F-2747 TaxID=1463843 RepID=UPI00068CF0D9|nr:non-ribosomal peptide synthetase [Streptomyces sp. NRRL F-2747]
MAETTTGTTAAAGAAAGTGTAAGTATAAAGAGARSLADTRKALLALRERQRTTVRATSTSITPAARDRALPLSFTQQRLWFLNQWSQGRPVYNAPSVLRLRAPLDLPAFRRALTALVGRHEILRTRYPELNGVAYQHVDPAPAEVPLPVTDLGALRGAEQETAVEAHVRAEIRHSFDLAAEHALRVSLVRLGPQEHVLVLAMHHIATDGWSTDILTRELVALYRAEAAGTAAGLPELPVQYADFAVWQRGHLTGEVLDKQLAYWRERLAGAATLDFPADRPRPADPTRDGATLTRMLPDELLRGLHRTALAERATLLTVVLAAFTALMSRYTGQDDVVLGSVFSGRTRPEIENLIGFFSNTLVLRTSTEGDPTFRELLRRTGETVMGAHFNQDLPFGTLVDELAPERDPSRNPLFQTCFTLQHAAAAEAEAGGLSAEPYPADPGTARFDLAVQLTEVPGQGLRLWAEYSTELFDTDRIERLFGHYARLLRAVTENPELRLSELPLLTDAEHEQLVRGWNDTARTHGSEELCLHQLFESAADAHPDAVAVVYEGEALTYRELDERADRLARALRAQGVGPESVVGVLARRGPALPVAFLAVHKAGGGYLPLDPDHPAARWELLLEEAGARTAVTTADLAGELPAPVTAVLADDPALADGPAPGRLPASAGPRNLAYVIFTSGSTGRPKGVQVEHRSIVNFSRAITELFRMGPGDRVLQFANPSYDVSLFDFFSALTSGAALVQAPRETLLDPGRLTALMREQHVTVADLPPAVLGALDPAALPELRMLFVGLEAFPGELVNRWNTGGREFHNGYGPTEATVACIDYNCPKTVHDSMPPIGTPLANYTAHVVDRFGALVPVGVPGELLVGGAGVARGYLNSPELTDLKFVPDPYGDGGDGGDGGEPGRLYRTGDLVVRRADGNLEFRGRVDQQVKIRGLRIEPGEIEQALTAEPEIAEAVVVAHGEGADARLVAYVVPAPGTDAPDEGELRRRLGGRLPAHLVPALFAVLAELPRAASGKLDRARLPEPEAAAAAVEFEAPSTPTQIALAGIWEEILGRGGFSTHDGFFAVGGNSLKITQFAARVRERFGVELELRDLFVNSTLGQLAELVEERELASADDAELLALLERAEAAGGGAL